jgi:hypothetical protein
MKRKPLIRSRHSSYLHTHHNITASYKRSVNNSHEVTVHHCHSHHSHQTPIWTSNLGKFIYQPKLISHFIISVHIIPSLPPYPTSSYPYHPPLLIHPPITHVFQIRPKAPSDRRSPRVIPYSERRCICQNEREKTALIPRRRAESSSA